MSRETAVEARWAVLKEHATEIPTGHVLLTLSVIRTEDGYTSECPELGVPSFGMSLEDALTAAMDATLVYLNEIERLGLRPEVFEERNIAFKTGAPMDNLESIQTTLTADGPILKATSLGLVACG